MVLYIGLCVFGVLGADLKVKVRSNQVHLTRYFDCRIVLYEIGDAETVPISSQAAHGADWNFESRRGRGKEGEKR